MDAWREMRAAELGRGIGRGEIDPRALCETFLDAIGGHPQGARIYARTTPDRARAEAEAAHARARSGTRRGPLDGVPVSWKDLFDTAGTATEAGSALLRGRVPERDAAVLASAARGGAVCLGKTHLSELAFSGLGLNPVTGTPPQRHDPDAVPGGSSSGAAASLWAGLAPLAIGSDTGGSVRIPAAWNDLVGLKTTAGRLPLEGAVPLVESFDTVGPLARSVEDAALALALLEGGRAPDLRGATLRGARLLVLADFEETSRDAPRRAFAAAMERLEAAGARVERRALDCVEASMALAGVLFAPEAWAIWGETIERDPEAMFPRILDRFRSGREARGHEVMAAWRRLRALRAEFAAATAGYDAVCLPSVASLPPPVVRLMEEPEFYVEENLLALRNTRVGNQMGLCGLTLPAGAPACGLMLLGRPMGEARLLRLGAAAEAALADGA
jgi:aspartyl-tRNA(Asn)/glutamyl-tRNA(Gln) amidotransferase subunit A